MMELTNTWGKQVLNYVITHQNVKIKYHLGDMWLIIHSDASYINEENARSNYGENVFSAGTNPTMHPSD